MAVITRRMREEDLPAVGELAGQLVRLHHQWDSRRFFFQDGVEEGYRTYFRSQLNNERTFLFVAELDGAVVAYVYGTLEGRDWAKLLDPHAAIHDLFVALSARGRGVARTLMQLAMAEMEKRAPRVVLYSATANAEAQKLFDSLGFRRTMVEMTRG